MQQLPDVRRWQAAVAEVSQQGCAEVHLAICVTTMWVRQVSVMFLCQATAAEVSQQGS